jgi:hypothetical protein
VSLEKYTVRAPDGCLSYVDFAEMMRVPHGTVKRWVHEGMPVDRHATRKRCWVPVQAATKWLESRQPHTAKYYESSYIYVAQRRPDGAIKIGWTRDIERRLRELRKGIRSPVTLIACVPGDHAGELSLQERFAAHRVDGEWFMCEGRVAEFVESVGLAFR